MACLHVIILMVLAIACKAQDTCPQGWSSLDHQSGRAHHEHVGPILNKYRQLYHAHYPDYKFKKAEYSDSLGNKAAEFSQTCNLDYLLAHQNYDTDNYNVSVVFLNGSAYLWQVSDEQNCTADWDAAMDTFFKGIDWQQNDQICYTAQLNKCSCAFHCFDATLTPINNDDKSNGISTSVNNTSEENGSKEMITKHIRLYNCNYDINCNTNDGVNQKCADFCKNYVANENA